MRLKKGDTIVCIVDGIEELTYGKRYQIKYVRVSGLEDDICISDDLGLNWWFDQIGGNESWTMWFVDETQWERNEKLQILINK